MSVACTICREIGERMSVNVDNELPPVLGRLKPVTWFDSNQTGLAGYGFKMCPECGAYYYWESEYSFTGSQMNDDHNIYRLNSIETALVEPLLSAVTQDASDQKLIATLEKVMSYLAGMPYRGAYPRDIVVAMIRALSDKVSNAHIRRLLVQPLTVFVHATPKNRAMVKEIVDNSYFKINKEVSGVKELYAAAQSL